MDPLSEVLSLLKPRAYTSGGLDLGGEWSIGWGPYDGIKCYALVSGQCWLSMEGVPDPVLITAGDCFLLSSGRPFRLASDLALPSVEAPSGFRVSPNGTVTSYNGGGDCFGLGGHFALDGDSSILLGVLPAIVHLSSETDRVAMRWSLERMMHELRDPQPGGSLVAQQLAYMMLVQALRQHLAKGANGDVGWLFALADAQISKAVTCIHSHPARHWTLQELAEHAGMSRSGFALRFKQIVGLTPMEYLTRWRLLLAGDRLANSADSLSSIAASVGYDSESAFSVAFKRVIGVSPRQFSRGGASIPFLARVNQSNHVDALQLSMG